MQCILCESKKLSKLDSISTKYLVKTYNEQFKTDLSYLFNNSEISLYECTNCALQFYFPTITGDSNYYNVLQKNDWYYRSEKDEYNYAKSYIKPNDQILDIGCGNGSFAKYVPDAHFTGLEFSSDAVSTGLKNGISIINESIEQHATKNSLKYDVVTMFQVLEHVSNIREFVQSAAACVKPGGKLIVAVPSEESYIKYKQNGLLNMPPHHISRWTDEALTNLSKEINFNIVQIYHEKLDPINKVEFLTIFFERSLAFNLSERVPLVNEKKGFSVRNRIAYRLASSVAKRKISNAFLPIGQTVTAVYQKPD